MKNFYCICLILLGMHEIVAQSEIRVVNGRIEDVNNSGNAVGSLVYYNYANDQLTVETNSDVVTYAAISNNEIVIAEILADPTSSVSSPGSTIGYRINNVWHKAPFLNNSTPQSNDYALAYDVSQNNQFVVGIASDDGGGSAHMFRYDLTQPTAPPIALITNTSTYEFSSALGVSNSGVAVGWVDPDSVGTLRIPAMVEDFMIEEIIGNNTIDLIINEASHISSDGSIVVGQLNGQPFIYEVDNEVFTLYTVPSNFDSGSFIDIADNGLILGYYHTSYGREPILFHPALGSAPVLLIDEMPGLGLSVPSTFDNPNSMGFPLKISNNGQYIIGFENSAFLPTSKGWIMKVDVQELLSVQESELAPEWQIYPTVSSQNNLYLRASRLESPLIQLKVYTLDSKEIVDTKIECTTSDAIALAPYLPTLPPGVYLFCISTDTKKVVQKVIVK